MNHQDKTALPPLTPAQLEHAKRMKREWIAGFGDDSTIRKLRDAGLISGWRNVVSVKRLESKHEHD